MAQTFKTATKFSGLQTYPNSLSEVQPGALQLADNVVLDKPGVVSPRRGQRVYSSYVINLLTANQATGGDALVATTGFFTGELATYNSPSVGPILQLVGPDAAQAWQGDYCTRIYNLAGSPTDGVCLFASVPAGTFTFSTYTRIQGASGLNIQLEVVQSDGTVLVNTTTPAGAGFGNDWTRVSGSFTLADPADIQIGLTLDVGNDNILYIDGLQLETNAVATLWTTPEGLICARLFQVGTSLYGFFTSDGLPTSPGRFTRVVSTVTGASQPSGAVAAFSVTPNTFYPPPANAVHSLEMNKNTFFTTNDGIMKLLAELSGADSGSMVPAGMPYALDVQAALATPAAGTLGFLAGGYATAYRVVWGNTDPSGNLTLGAPSPAVVVSNPKLAQGATDSLQATSGIFTFTALLPYTVPGALGSNTVRGFVVQGGQASPCRILFATSSNHAMIILDAAFYFGPVGTPISLAFEASGNFAGVTFSNVTPTDPRYWGPAGGTTVYQPFNTSAPAAATGAVSVSTLATAPSSTSFTVASAVAFTAGTVGLVIAATVSTAQLFSIDVFGPVLQPNDQVQLTGVTGRVTVTSVSGGGFTAVVTPFPTGAVNGDGVTEPYTIYRPSNTTVTFPVPEEAYLYTATSTGQDSAVFYQVYRSATQQQIIDGIATSPTDDMRQCYQGVITGTAPGTSAIISFTDVAPDATLGTDLYTSPRQQGILASQYQPPVVSDAILYQGSSLFANAYTAATFSTQLLAVSATPTAAAALQDGDTITVNGVVFTAKNAPVGATQFAISAGSGSVTTDANTTVANFSRAVNAYYVLATDAAATGENVTLLSTSTPTSMGGNMTWRASRGLGTFTLTYTPGGATPGHDSPFTELKAAVPLTTGPENQPNALYYSPQGQPEAVPLLNSLSVGSANYGIKRILTLPGSCIVFKADGSIYQLTGNSPSQFSVALLNSTSQLLSTESAVQLQSSVVAFTSQGVVTISPGGTQILSTAINDDLFAVTQLPAFASTSFGVAHEAERRYLLYTPSETADTLPTQAFVYNIQTNAWTKWQTPRLCGLVNSADSLLYMGSAEPSIGTGLYSVLKEASVEEPVGRERASVDVFNYGDEVVSGTLTVTSTTTATLTGLATGVGTALPAGFPAGSAVVTATGIDYPTSITTLSPTSVALTFTNPTTLVSGAAALYQAVAVSFAPVPIAGDDADTVKQFQEFVMYFSNTTCPNIAAMAQTDFNQDYTVLPFAPPGQSALPTGYGSGSWGLFPWGGGATTNALQPYPVRQLVPKGATRGHVFWPTVSASIAANYFDAQALTLSWTLMKTLRSK